MGESRVSSGRGCRRAKGDGSRESMGTVDVAGEFIAIVRGNVGSGSVGCGDGGGVVRFKWLAMAVSMISTAVSSASVITGVVMGVGDKVLGVVKMCRWFPRTVTHGKPLPLNVIVHFAPSASSTCIKYLLHFVFGFSRDVTPRLALSCDVRSSLSSS